MTTDAGSCPRDFRDKKNKRNRHQTDPRVEGKEEKEA